MHRTFTLCGSLVVVAAFATPSWSQTRAMEARTALERKQRDRQIARAATTQVTVGTLEDLRAEVRQLRAENAALKQRLVVAERPLGRRYLTIEVGMTRQELIAFVRARSSEMQFGAFSSRAGGTFADREQTIVVTTRSATTAPAAPLEHEDTTIERRKSMSKRDEVTVDLLGYVPAVIGTASNAGGISDVVSNVKVVTGQVHVELTDDIVTAVSQYR